MLDFYHSHATGWLCKTMKPHKLLLVFSIINIAFVFHQFIIASENFEESNLSENEIKNLYAKKGLEYFYVAYPAVYKQDAPLRARVEEGKSQDLTWRASRDRNSTTLRTIAEKLHIEQSELERLQIDPRCGVLDSPSGKYVLLHTYPSKGDTSYYAKVFEIHNGKADLSNPIDIPAINFGDKQRWRITWNAFLSETKIIGTLIDDGDIFPELPCREIKYVYNIKTKTMNRLIVDLNLFQYHCPVDTVANNAFLFVATGGKQMTIYVDD